MEHAPAFDSKTRDVQTSRFPALKSAPHIFAGGLGIEPKLTASKAAVLPLDDPPKLSNISIVSLASKAAVLPPSERGKDEALLIRSERAQAESSAYR